MDKTIKQSVSEMYIAALEASLLNQATARKEARLVAAQARLAGAEADLEAARKAVACQQASFEALEKVLEAAREAVFEQASVRRQARKSLNKVARKAALVKGNIKLEAITASELQAAWLVLEGVVGEYYSRLDHARRQEEAAYAAYSRLQSARRAQGAAAIARDHASFALYRAEAAPVVVRMPVLACRAAARKADEAVGASFAAREATLVSLQIELVKARRSHVDWVQVHGTRLHPEGCTAAAWESAALQKRLDQMVLNDGTAAEYLELLLLEEAARHKALAVVIAIEDKAEASKRLCKVLDLEAQVRAVRQARWALDLPVFPVQRAWVPKLPGARLSTDTAPEAAKLAVIQARKAWEADRCAANLRKLNSALAQAAHGAPLDAVGAPAKPVGRALVDSTRIEPVYEALRRNIHSLDSRLGRLLCAFALRGDDKKVVSRVTKAVTLLFGSLPSEVRDATYWGIQKAAAKQAFIALKSGALDATKRGWTERALVENARLFAAVCAARLDGEAFAPAQANGLDPLDAVQEYQELATDLEGQFAFEGEEEVELGELDFSEGVYMDAADEDEDEGVDEDDSLDQVVELLAAEGDRQIDSLLGYSAHWDELPEMFAKVKVASTEEAMKKAVSVATEAFESELLRDFL